MFKVTYSSFSALWSSKRVFKWKAKWLDLNVQLSDADGGLVLCISGSDWNAQKKKSMELYCNAYITWGNDLPCILGSKSKV